MTRTNDTQADALYNIIFIFRKTLLELWLHNSIFGHAATFADTSNPTSVSDGCSTDQSRWVREVSEPLVFILTCVVLRQICWLSMKRAHILFFSKHLLAPLHNSYKKRATNPILPPLSAPTCAVQHASDLHASRDGVHFRSLRFYTGRQLK